MRLHAVLFALATPGASPPTTCAAIDETADMLGADDRRTALALIRQALSATGRTVVESGCAETVTVSHVRVGSSINVAVRAAGGARVARAASMESLPDTYLALLRDEGPLTATTAAAPAAAPSTHASASSRSWFGFGAGHGQLYARLGYHGTTAGDDAKFGPSLGIGYRFEVGRLLLDASTANLNFWRRTQRDSYDETWNAYLRLMAFRYVDDLVGVDLYAGGGLSYGQLRGYDEGIGHGDGMQGEIGIGYEMLRTTVVRAFVQLVTSVPFYALYSESHIHPAVVTERRDYGLTTALSVGVGF